MPRWLRIVVWFAIFAVCAAAGAFVASRTDPFPPGVDDPGARPAETGNGDRAQTERWRLSIRGASVREFRVGGACRSAWRGAVPFRIDADGVLEGDGSIVLSSWDCDFEVAQVQADEVELELLGVREPDRTTVRLGIVAATPGGSVDLGGFVDTIDDGAVRFDPDETRVRSRREAPDVGEGAVRSDVTFVLRCVAGCEAGGPG